MAPSGGQRYLFADAHWDGRGRLSNGCRGPILFYTGNEGPIDAFWGSNGFMTQVLALRFGVLLVFAEERYYGESKPQARGHFDYLSTEQVLADYAALLASLKPTSPRRRVPWSRLAGALGRAMRCPQLAAQRAPTCGRCVA